MDEEKEQKAEGIRESVRHGYAEIAKGLSGGCCGSGSPTDFASQIGYTTEEMEALPDGANMGLSCGNPTALANLKTGQVVLDLGSGGGFDVFIAARKVGPTGRAIGVDMTPEMLSKARAGIPRFTAKTGLANVEFRLGEIEHLPVADSSVDVVISNCVINLSADKPQVWHEIARVLKPGGRVCVSDLALKKRLPEAIREMVVALVGCVAGAVTIDETVKMAEAAGFADIQTAPKEYALDVMEHCNDKLYKSVKDALPEGARLSDYVVSVDYGASKPAGEAMSPRHKELAAIAASVTAHCQPCLLWHLDKARKAGVSEIEIEMALAVGRAVQKGSVAAMESFVKEQERRYASPDPTACEPGTGSCCGGQA